ncbi:MAG: DUF5110 domain-containing protein [Bacilli bacterium]|nr:DUF5110 domain-containing protein [Bacilli bacterium]
MTMIKENGNPIIFENGDKKIAVEFLVGGFVRVYEKKAKTDLIEISYRKSNAKIEVKEGAIAYGSFELSFDDEASLIVKKSGKDYLVVKHTHEEGNNVSFSFNSESHIYGLGDKMAQLDKKGYAYRQWNTDCTARHDELEPALYKSLNFILLEKESTYCGLFFPSTYPYDVDLGLKEENKATITSKDAPIDYFLFLEDTPKEIVSAYSSLVGHPYMVRLKMLGNNQSRWGYESEALVREVVSKYRENQIPLDYLHFDIFYMDGYRDFTSDKTRFPNLKNLTSWMKDKNVEAVCINDAGIKLDPEFDVYNYCKDNGLISTQNGKELVATVWPGDSIFPKYYHPKAQTFFGDKAYAFMKENGFSGLWNDMNEPVSFKGELPEDVDFSIPGRKVSHLEEHNVYGEHMIRCFSKIFERDNIRPYLFSRACFATTPKYAFVWNGDNYSLWHHLRSSIPQVLTLSLCGAMFNGDDIGGFGGHGNRELLIRWVEANILFPFFRNHSTLNTKAQEPYAYDEETKEIYTHYLNIRYELLPYLYNCVEEMSSKGIPMVRPLFYNYPLDEKSKCVNDQYMVGDDIMVAPIVDQGATVRSVYFPKGNWYDYETGEKYKGGRYYAIPMPLGKTGIYVRGNTIIPCFKKGLQYIEKEEIDTLVLRLYGNKGKCRLYEDDGKTLDYKKGKFNVYAFSFDKKGVTYKYIEKEYESPFRTLKIKKGGKEASINFKENKAVALEDLK